MSSGDPIHGGRHLLPATLFCLELVVGVQAVYGGVMLVTDAWRLPLDHLDPLPLHSWVPPGIALLAGVAAPMLAAATLIGIRSRHAPAAAVVAGALLLGWIAVQVLVAPFFWLQPVMAASGAAIGGLGWWWRTRWTGTPAWTARHGGRREPWSSAQPHVPP
jgi:hypothetical protein